MSSDDFQVVYTAHGELDAEMIKAFLASNGIEAVIAGESISTTYGIILAPLGDFDIIVSAERADDARSLLDAMERGDLDPDRNQP